MTYSDLNNDGKIDTPTEILQENHYYPYGLTKKGPWMEGLSAPMAYQFNGIEKIDNFGLGVNMARYRTLDPALGVWWSVDPAAEVLAPMSPYCAMNGSPMVYNDPDGDIAPLVALAIVAGTGGLLNLGTAAISGKVNSVGAGIGYFLSGAAGAGTAVFNPYAGYAITTGGNLVTDIATGNIPDKDASTLSKIGYVAGLGLSGLNATGAVKLVGAISPITLQAAKVAFTNNYIQLVSEAGKTLAYISPKDPFYTALKEATGGGGRTVLSSSALEKSANATFISSKGFETSLTEAGRAVTKHPQLFGYETTEALRQAVRSESALNQLGQEGIKNILEKGRFGIEYAKGVGSYTATFRLPNGYGAWWQLNGKFIGFLNPRF